MCVGTHLMYKIIGCYFLCSPLFTASNGQPRNQLLFRNDMLTSLLDENALDFINCIANVYVYLSWTGGSFIYNADIFIAYHPKLAVLLLTLGI